jgi:small subunit ribosomal protein S18
MAKKAKLRISTRLLRKRARKSGFGTSKHCRFCASKEVALGLDYKNSTLLKNFLTERGKILPSRISGNCSRHQRHLTKEIKQSRVAALLPFAAHH